MALLFVFFCFWIVSGITEYFFGQYINSLPQFIILLPWIIVNILDVHSTLLGLENDNEEENPLARWLIKKFGTKKGLVIGKLVFITPMTFLILFLDKTLLVAWTIVIALVVIWNYCLVLCSKDS